MNKTLTSLLETLPHEQCVGSQDVSVEAITLDSRVMTSSTLFIAQKGETLNGHEFIELP